MSNVKYGVIVGLLVAIGTLLAFPLLSPGRASPQWEYRIEGLKDVEFRSELDRIGRGGWELVFARRAVNGESDDREAMYEVIFKRPM